MGQKKLIRFQEIKSFSNVKEFFISPLSIENKCDFFNDNAVYTLELACGKAEYTIQLSQKYPKRNFVAVDIKGNRLWVAAKYCLENNISNAYFLRTYIENINYCFTPKKIEEIWITFPDPYLKKPKKRLTHPKFLKIYQKLIMKNGTINLKTDSFDLFSFTKQIIEKSKLSIVSEKIVPLNYSSLEVEFPLNIQTHYEKLNISNSKKIYFLSFLLDNEISEMES